MLLYDLTSLKTISMPIYHVLFHFLPCRIKTLNLSIKVLKCIRNMNYIILFYFWEKEHVDFLKYLLKKDFLNK